MAKRPKMKMAKATLDGKGSTDPAATKKLLKRALRDEREITSLCAQLQRATRKADQALAGFAIEYGVRKSALETAAANH